MTRPDLTPLAPLAVATQPYGSPDMVETIVRTMVEAQMTAVSVRRQVALTPTLKRDRSPVTIADLAVQAIVADTLCRMDPATPIVGEERLAMLPPAERAQLIDAATDAVRCSRPTAAAGDVVAAIDACNHDGSASDFWTIDPIDGTKGFIRGHHFSIALARIRSGAVVFAALACPTLGATRLDAPGGPPEVAGLLFVAADGGGSWQLDLGRDPASSTGLRLPPARDGDFRLCESFESTHSDQGASARIAAAAGAISPPVRIDGQTKYVLVARGDVDAHLRVPVARTLPDAIWDHAAGSLIAREAGASVSDLDGAALDFSRGTRLALNRGIVAAHPAVHARLMEAIRRDRDT